MHNSLSLTLACNYTSAKRYNYGKRLMSNQLVQEDKIQQLSPLQRATFALKKLDAKLNRILYEPIAIVGMGCSFPGGANTPEKFWELLHSGTSACEEIPAGRWDINSYYNPEREAPGKIVTRYGHFISEVDRFDPGFFGISPREAIAMDPQHRLLLEVSWQALERAGQKVERLSSDPVGVFVGSDAHDYEQLMKEHLDQEPNSPLTTYTYTGNSPSSAAGRLAYTFGFTGPTATIDTACSSSLVAIHQACNSIRLGECKMAIAGGVKLHLTPNSYIFTSRAGMISPDGLCKTFDTSADGYGRGEGCGMLVLKSLSQAQADGDPILALIRGSAVNQDGSSSGLTVPNGQSQQKLIKQALEQARVEPADISYLEAHGTGTSLGDPIEVNAAVEVLGKDRSPEQPLWIGTVKTNIGHLESASGIAGLMKVVLSLQHQQIPAHLHLQEPNPKIDWQPWLQVPQALTPWVGSKGRLAGVSSFGFTGTNTHVVLSEAPAPIATSTPEYERPLHLLQLSAKNDLALAQLAQSYSQHLEKHPEQDLGDICFTANSSRLAHKYRLAVFASNLHELQQKLNNFGTDSEGMGVATGQVNASQLTKVAMLFTGQGSQYVNMARELYETQPTFRKTLEECDAVLSLYLEKPLLSILYPQPGENSPIDETAYTQPAIFAIAYALAQLWKSWGIEPSVVMGHSVGEYVAATVAGVFSLEDALKLIAHRGRLMQQLPSGGGMLSIMASEEKVNQVIAPYSGKVAIAAINGPQSIVISGEIEAIVTVKEIFEAQDIKTKQLQVSHAFHSHLMEPMLADFRVIASEVTFKKPTIPLISNVTGERADESITTADNWVNHVRKPVKFAQSMETLHKEGYEVFLEMGPKPILLGMGRQCLPDGVGVWLPSLRPGYEDWQQILQSLGELYVRGVKVDWLGFDREYSRSKVILPTYPFQRQRYWIEINNNLIHNKQLVSNHQNLHPLLGQRLHLAALEQQIRFECQINAFQPNYLQDHCVFSQPVFPAAAYLEIALAAGSNLFNSDNLILENVVIQQALILSKDEIKTIQVILTPQSEQSYNFQIFSLDIDPNSSEPKWVLHVEGKLLAGNKDAELETTNLKAIKGEYNQQISPTEFYQEFETRGLYYGSSFQAVKQLWHGEGKALGDIQLPENEVNVANSYQLHPVVLDASFQILAAAVGKMDNEEAYLPVEIKRLEVYRGSINSLWTQAEIARTTGNETTLTSKINLLDERGIVVGRVEGLTLLRTSRQALLRNIEPDFHNWLYQINWQSIQLPQNQSIDFTKSGSWLLFSPATDIGKHLAEFLEQKGQHCILVTPGENFQQLESQHYQINPTNPDQFLHLLESSLEQQPPLQGIVHLWSLDSGVEELQKSQELTCGSVLHLVQALVKNQDIENPSLWLVTQGSQSVGNDSLPIEFQQTPLWGLGRVIVQEHRELKCRCLDLDPTVEDSQTVAAILAELLSPGEEDQIAYRQGVRYVARLERQQKTNQSTQSGLKIPSQQAFQLKLSEYGSLENLMLQPTDRRSPAPEEVEIQVKAVGLNFRDVLNVLGLLKDYYAQHFGITSAQQLTFGFECVGTIVAVGEGVTQVQVGDEVMVNRIHDAFSSFVTTRVEFVIPKPRQLSSFEAATIPLTFLTAYYGLHHLAEIKPGERVLIHAAGGGVGQAAVQLAQQAGAEIFATASPSKWEFLKSMGVQHVMNSRTLDFAQEVMNLTQGQGVDVVFNSLNGDFITKNFEILAPGGRFIEIGKIGIWDENQVKQFRPDAEYFPFDLGEVSEENPSLILQMQHSLVEKFEQGSLQALPHKVFPIEKVVEAFRYMQQSKHIGKVVVSIPDTPKLQVPIQAEASYLITGGLGALGLKTAEWMVQKGAKHLVLTGRRQPTSKAQQTIEQLQKTGAQVSVLCGDISQQEDVAKIVESIKVSLPPLRGIIHAAGVLDDSLLLNMNWQQLTRVMAPKVQGAWYLHNLTQNLPLDFFVCFSSMASILGSPGQGNYAAANAFMDGLAHYRRSMGLPGLSINWGPWSQQGMIANLDSSYQGRMVAKGMTFLSSEQGLKVLGQLLKQSISQVGVLLIQWPVFCEQLSFGNPIPLLSRLVKETKSQQKIPRTKTKHDVLQQLKAALPREREQLLMTYIKDEISQVLSLSTSQIDVQQPLNTMGLDSLMAVELHNRLQTYLLIDIPIVKFMEDISIVDLHTEMSKQATQIAQNQGIESKNNQQIYQSNGKENKRIRGEL